MAGDQGQSWQEAQGPASLLHSQETALPFMGMDTLRCGFPTSGLGAGQGRGQHPLTAGSQRSEGQSHALINVSLMIFGN